MLIDKMSEVSTVKHLVPYGWVNKVILIKCPILYNDHTWLGCTLMYCLQVSWMARITLSSITAHSQWPRLGNVGQWYGTYFTQKCLVGQDMAALDGLDMSLK